MEIRAASSPRALPLATPASPSLAPATPGVQDLFMGTTGVAPSAPATVAASGAGPSAPATVAATGAGPSAPATVAATSAGPSAPAAVAASSAGPSDASDIPASARGMDIISRLERIPKREHAYELRGHASAPDGSLYLLYGARGESAGYVSRLLPDGTIDWEAPVEAPRCLAVDGQGGVQVAGPKGISRFTAGGLELEKRPVPEGADPAWIDASRAGSVGVGRLGNVVASPSLDVPGAIHGQYVETVAMSPRGDSLHLGAKDGWAVFEEGGHSRYIPAPKDPETPGMWVFTDDVHPLADGGALFEIHRTIEIPMRPFVGGILMPNHRGPRELGHDYDGRISLRRCAPDGTTLWETGVLGRMLEVDASRDGSAWAVSESHGEVGSNTVSHVLPDGTVGHRVEVPGPAYTLVANGHEAYVSNSRGISWCGPKGETAIVPGSLGWRARAVGADGRLLVAHEDGRRAALLEPKTGALVPVTDLEHDHVLTRREEIEMAMRNAPEPPSLGPVPSVIQDDGDSVVIGGVRVPRRAD